MSGRKVQRPGSLAGNTDIAQLLGVSRQRALVISMIEGFPRPIDEIAAGPVYDRAEVEAWLASRRAERAEQEGARA